LFPDVALFPLWFPKELGQLKDRALRRSDHPEREHRPAWFILVRCSQAFKAAITGAPDQKLHQLTQELHLIDPFERQGG
jgi:hypothetical protein